MWRYLPLAVLTTAVVIVLPAAILSLALPGGGLLVAVLSGVLAVIGSLGLAAAGAAVWKRQRRSRDVVFADLMLWCWVRRLWTERRLSQARELFDAARRAGPNVNIELLTGLSRLLEARDSYVHGHSQRVARHAVRIARAMGLSPVEIAKIRSAAEVHDVGKIYTPREILNNPRLLTDAEFDVIKLHAVQGAEMVSAVGDPEITSIVRHHHERIDGRGYPDRLAGEAIPLGARIIAVADTFDAITSDRAYRPAGAQKTALEVLARESGTQLDSLAVAAFLEGYSARRSVAGFALGSAAVQRAFTLLHATSPGVGALIPAVAAAGALGLSPGLFRTSEVAQHAGGGDTLIQALQSTVGSPTTPGTSPQITRPVDLKARTPRGVGRGGTPQGSPVSTPSGSRLATLTPNAGAPTEASSEGPSHSPVGKGPVVPVPIPPVSAPETPRVPLPSTPPLTLPSVTTPSVTTPSVSVPGVPSPTVTVPSVTVPRVTVPGG